MDRLRRIGDWLRLGLGGALRLLSNALSAFADRILPNLPSRPFGTDNSDAGPGFSVAPELAGGSINGAQQVSISNGIAPLEQGKRIYAVGDIHGRADLLKSLIDMIEKDCEDYNGDTTIIFLGDYIDRGFQSRQVLDLLLSDRLSDFHVYCLKGNHEEAMLQFLADASFGTKWAAYGGRETLVSYGVRPPKSISNVEEWEEAQTRLIDVLPMTHEKFLMQLLPSVRIGDYGFVHAGVKPGIPFDRQQERDLLWIRDEFLNNSDMQDVMIVHGHTPTERPHQDHRRINVDTGAYISGRLTAVRLEEDTIAFLSTAI